MPYVHGIVEGLGWVVIGFISVIGIGATLYGVFKTDVDGIEHYDTSDEMR